MCEIHPRPSGSMEHLIFSAKLADEIENVSVAGEPVMIELFQAGLTHGEAACQPPHFIIGLTDGDSQSPLYQFPCGRKPGEAGTDHHDMRCLVPAHATAPDWDESESPTVAGLLRGRDSPSASRPATVIGIHSIRCVSSAKAVASAARAP